MPKGADVHGLANSGHGHTGAQRRASLHAQGVECDAQNAQAPLNPQKRKKRRTSERTYLVNCTPELHLNTRTFASIKMRKTLPQYPAGLLSESSKNSPRVKKLSQEAKPRLIEFTIANRWECVDQTHVNPIHGLAGEK